MFSSLNGFKQRRGHCAYSSGRVQRSAMRIEISIARQCLTLTDDQGEVLKRYTVSTAAKGAGEQMGSYQTPRGLHRIRAKIGAGLPLGAVLRGRRPTGVL